MTRERPILFSAPMVRAILDDTKTQTRRVVKPRKDRYIGCELAPGELAGEVNNGEFANCPYGRPGDRLWVRETWAYDDEDGEILYRADDIDATRNWDQQKHESGLSKYKWRPSIFMPRVASRITLEITEVRVERLNSISEADAIAEGLIRAPYGWWSGREGSSSPTPQGAYALLWQDINGPESWSANPWVWVIEFTTPAAGREA